MTKTIYLSGPITDQTTGQPRESWQQDFLDAEAKLRRMGFLVINPMDIAREVVDAFRWRFRFYGGPMNSTGEPLQPKRADYIMACLHRMQMAREADALHAVYVIGSDAEARQSIGVSMELHMATLLGVPIYGDGLAFASFNSDCCIEIVDGEIDELMKED